MDRKPDAEPKTDKTAKAKLDEHGRPVVEPAPKRDKRADDPSPVRAVLRLGVFALAMLSGPACDVAARAEPDPELVAAVKEAKAAAEQAKASEAKATKAAADSLEALRGCTDAMNATTDLVIALRKGTRFESAHKGR